MAFFNIIIFFIKNQNYNYFSYFNFFFFFFLFLPSLASSRLATSQARLEPHRDLTRLKLASIERGLGLTRSARSSLAWRWRAQVSPNPVRLGLANDWRGYALLTIGEAWASPNLVRSSLTWCWRARVLSMIGKAQARRHHAGPRPRWIDEIEPHPTPASSISPMAGRQPSSWPATGRRRKKQEKRKIKINY